MKYTSALNSQFYWEILPLSLTRTRSIMAASVIFTLLFPLPVMAINKCVGKEGNVLFTDRPCDDGNDTAGARITSSGVKVAPTTLTDNQQLTSRQQRLEKNHDLIMQADDPEISWFSTRATTDLIIANPGGSYSVELTKDDGSGNSLGPVNISLLRIVLRIQSDENNVDSVSDELISNYVSWDDEKEGRLLINVPKDMSKGRLLIGIRPNFEDKGNEAIAERWSIPIIVEIWPTRPNVLTVKESDVYFPTRIDGGYRDGSAFDAQSVKKVLKLSQTDPQMKEYFLRAIVVKALDLKEGQLIAYGLPDPKGGIYPYGGKVEKIINGDDDQQLVLLNFKLLDVYDRMKESSMGLIKLGVMPEFVTYRSGGKNN